MKKSYLLILIGIALAVITSCKKKDPAIPPVPPTPHGGDVQTMPYTQSFATEFGTYIAKNVVGDQAWEIDFQSAKMAGAVKENGVYVNYENEDWLISSPVKITGVEHAKMVMTYIGCYFNNINNDITVWASEDYSYGNMPETADWTKVNTTFVGSSNWETWGTAEISLDEFVGKTVTIAVKYISDTVKAGTIEIKSISIEEGQASGGGGGQGGEVQEMPYTQLFAAEFGTYCTKNVIGDQEWKIDYSSAVMSGHVKVGDEHFYYENEDWLISSPVKIENITHAKMVMNYAAKYNGPSNDITIQVSSDYVFNEMPSTATWAELPVTIENQAGNAWTFSDMEISLDNFIGQTVTVAVKFTSTNEASRTIEIKSITVEEGDVTPTPPGPTPPGPGTGSGTADDPYNVASGISLQGQDVVAWVKGYIVGAVKDGFSSVSSNDEINWSAPFDLKTNVLIADDANCREISQCVIVNLPNNKPLRTQVNLVDNPDNLGKQLAVNGKLRTYFGQAGLRDSSGTESDFVLEGGVTPPTPPTPGTEIFKETFASGQGQFTIVDVELTGTLNFVWSHAANYSCMKGTGFYQQANDAESWLVSPSIDLTGVDTATLSFEQAVNYAAPDGLSVVISANYNGDVEDADWMELDVDQWPAGNNWTFINSTADLTDYVGQAVTIAFRYTSTTSSAATWEVKNVVVAE